MNGTETSGSERIASVVRSVAEAVDDPENYRVLIPTDIFDEVLETLETAEDLGCHHNGVRLCYTDHHEKARLEYASPLEEYGRQLHTENQQTSPEEGS